LGAAALANRRTSSIPRRRRCRGVLSTRLGGSFGGFYYGVQGYGGYPDDSGNIGPQVNSYSDFAGVLGTGVYVTGVAGTSVTHAGVYGQTGDGEVPEGIAAGVFGASPNVSGDIPPGVVGWSAAGIGVGGSAYQDDGVYGVSVLGRGVCGDSDESVGVQGHSSSNFGVVGSSSRSGPLIPNPVTIGGVWGSSDTVHGVIGTSNQNAGVFGYSKNSIGVVGQTSNPASLAGIFLGNVGVNGTLFANVKNALVPFPDGSSVYSIAWRVQSTGSRILAARSSPAVARW
jgi:hypothetical protein